MEIKESLVLLFLGMNTYSDLKKCRILLWSAVVFGFLGILSNVLMGDLSLLQTIASLLPGFLFLGISKITQEALGYGDGIIVLVLGTYISVQDIVWMLMISILLSAVWGGILLIFMKKGKKEEFPFLPFLLLGYLGKVCL